MLYYGRHILMEGEIMTYKQIEASREARLWIGQIIVPATSVVVSIMSIPEVRRRVAAKAMNVKESIQNRTKRWSR